MRNQSIQIPFNKIGSINKVVSIKKIVALAIYIFIGLFAVQVVYRILNPVDSTVTDTEIKQILNKSQKNYSAQNQNNQNISIANIYEKIAFFKLKSKSFDTDQTQLLNLVKESNGIIQLEQQVGLIGERVYYISAGIQSHQFDNVMNKAKEIASLESNSIETISRPDQITNINNLNTIQFVLIEDQSNSISFMYRSVFDSFIWAIAVMFMVLLFGSFVGFGVWIFVLVNRQIASKKDQRFE